MSEAHAIGNRLRAARKRCGLTQQDLASRSGVSLSFIRKVEQDDYDNGIRLETAHKLAVALDVPTSALITEDAPRPGQDSVTRWEPVRRALDGAYAVQPEAEPALAAVQARVRDAVSAVLDSRYADLRETLPALLRDTDAVVSVSADAEARRTRSRLRQLTAYMLGQMWQFPAAKKAVDLAAQDADDALTAMAAADWKCWLLLRQGRLSECAEIAAQRADEAEPRMSKATRPELAAWGQLMVRVSSAAARDNRPEDARDALRLARMAAVGAGGDFRLPYNPWQVFGPMTITAIQAENAMIQDHPDLTLNIGSQLEGRSFPVFRHYHRHRLDVAHAHVTVRAYPEAVAVLQDIRATAPEWLVQQRYARDILVKVVERRRSLTPEMRGLADFLYLPL